MSPAIFSATIIVGKLVFAHGIIGNMEASTTRNPGTPRTIPEGRSHCTTNVCFQHLLILQHVLHPGSFQDEVLNHESSQ
jgi:hypothetical protein